MRTLATIKTRLSVLLFLGTIAGTVPAHGYEALDKTIAVVDKQIILESELEQRLAQIRANQAELNINDAIRRRVLDQMILEQLQMTVAKRVEITIPEGEIEQQIDQLKRDLASRGGNFADYLRAQRQSEASLREAIRRELTLQNLQRGAINQRLRITEREIDEFLQSQAGRDWLTPRLRLNHILLPVDRGNEAAMVARAQLILRELQKPGVQFPEIARQVSAGPNAAQGGDLGWRTKDQLAALFYDAVVNLEAGAITGPLRSNAGIHILQVNERSGARPVLVQRYKVRHILIKPTELFTDGEAKAKIDGIYRQLSAGADFIATARKFTEDTASKASGGDLGWSTPGQFVPEFERVMADIPVGTVSPPFRSPFGWHILLVEDSKVEDMFETVKRNQVANILRQRRFEDELQLWLQELRENAYVEVLI